MLYELPLFGEGVGLLSLRAGPSGGENETPLVGTDIGTEALGLISTSQGQLQADSHSQLPQLHKAP